MTDETPDDWEDPQWDDSRVHNWHNYISDEIKSMWITFTDLQKQALARAAENEASSEQWD